MHILLNVLFIVVATVPSMEAEDMLLTSSTAADQPIRDEAVPEHIPPTVNVEPISTSNMKLDRESSDIYLVIIVMPVKFPFLSIYFL